MIFAAQDIVIGLRSVRRARVAVQDQALGDLFFLLGESHGPRHQGQRVGAVTGMRHDKAVIQVWDRG